MSAREELAKLLFIAGYPSSDADGYTDWEYLQSHQKYLAEHYRMADAVLAAGYVKP